MRTRFSLVAVVAACASAAGVAYAGGGPGAVYNDYAADGVLSCNHSRSDLVAVLRSGSLNEYGDPLTLARLKLAVRKQLAGGCRKGGKSGGSRGTVPAGARGGTTTSAGGQRSKPKHRRRHGRSKPAPPAVARASTGGGNGGFVAGRGLIVGLLVAVLALGGWLTKHALATRA